MIFDIDDVVVGIAQPARRARWRVRLIGRVRRIDVFDPCAARIRTRGGERVVARVARQVAAGRCYWVEPLDPQAEQFWRLLRAEDAFTNLAAAERECGRRNLAAAAIARVELPA